MSRQPVVAEKGEARDDLPPPAPRLQQVTLRPLQAPAETGSPDWATSAKAAQTGFFGRHWLFIVTVLAPLLVSSVYFFWIASNQYVSEAQFLVRTASQNDAGNLASFMQTQKISRASDETFAVANYLVSRDAFRRLVEKDGLRSMLARPQADFLHRFPNFYSGDTMDALYRHFLSFVFVKTDSDSGIATLQVSAFAPEDAQALATALLKDAEDLVNQLNTRLFEDAVKLSDKFVAEERAKIADIETRLRDFRNQQRVIDPAKESTAALENLGKLMATLMEAESSLSQETAQAPQSPHIASLRENVQALRAQVEAARADISGGQTSLAGKFNEFDELMLDRELAVRALGAAEARAISARDDLERKQFYLQKVVAPDLPDLPEYPKRALDVALTLILSLCVFSVARVILRNVAEHYT